MAKRNILDYQGNVIGELELPDGTSEEVWQSKLAPYAVNPSEGAAENALKFTIQQRKEFCEKLLDSFKKRNMGQGINAPQGLWLHHRMRALECSIFGVSYTLDVMNMAISGDVEMACIALQYMTLDDMSQAYHWMNADRRDYLVNEMKSFLGWA